MNSRISGFIPLVAGLLLPAAALAQTVLPVSTVPYDSSAVVSQLEQQRQMDDFKAKYWSQEPITQQDYYIQERQDRQLIAKISAGEPVSPDELARALRRDDTPY